MIALIAPQRRHQKFSRLHNEGRFDLELIKSGAGMVCRLVRGQAAQVVISLKD